MLRRDESMTVVLHVRRHRVSHSFSPLRCGGSHPMFIIRRVAKYRMITIVRGDLEPERRSPLWGPGTRVLLYKSTPADVRKSTKEGRDLQ
jgi:hypothetical protein